MGFVLRAVAKGKQASHGGIYKDKAPRTMGD
jgi:hypothetical protein